MMPHGKKILIVDDDPKNIFALKAVLNDRGFNCAVAQDAREAFHILENNGEFAVVLLDMMMPGIDGYEATRLIKSKRDFETLPVIAVTAQAMDGDKEKCLDAGADAYLSKPIDVDLLLQKLSIYINIQDDTGRDQ